jgi:hypothetical protein
MRTDKEPFSCKTEERFLAVEIDMTKENNARIHPGDIYALKGDAVFVIE